ncbi:MAG: hypothetical protein ABI402_14040 [Ferruginibacter sp.]
MKKDHSIGIMIFLTTNFCSCNEHLQKNEKVIIKADTIFKNKIPKDTIGNTPVIDFANEKFSKEKLKPIVKIFSNINTTKNWTSVKETDLNVSTEGGSSTSYFKNGELKKVAVIIYGEMGKIIKEYYLDKNKLVFVYEKEYKYNRPFYYDSAEMKGLKDTEVFDMDKSEITADRSYFENGILIHQSNNEDCGSPFDKSYLKEEEKRIQDEFDKLPLTKVNGN